MHTYLYGTAYKWRMLTYVQRAKEDFGPASPPRGTGAAKSDVYEQKLSVATSKRGILRFVICLDVVGAAPQCP